MLCRLCLVNVRHLKQKYLTLCEIFVFKEKGTKHKKKNAENGRNKTKKQSELLQSFCTLLVRRKINLSREERRELSKLHINLWLWIALFIVSDFFMFMHFMLPFAVDFLGLSKLGLGFSRNRTEQSIQVEFANSRMNLKVMQ
jgi:hypothetical protein